MKKQTSKERKRDERKSKSAARSTRHARIMRGVVTPILGLLAVACIGLGIMNATYWKPSSQIAASAAVKGTQYIVTDLSAIVNRNDGLQKGGLLEFLDPDRILKRMKDCVNPDLLDLREPEDLNCILRMLIVLIVPIMYNGIRPETDPEDREKLQHALEILRRGMGAKTHPAQRS